MKTKANIWTTMATIGVVLMWASSADAQSVGVKGKPSIKAEASGDAAAEVDTPSEAEAAAETPADIESENTVEACQDKVDNDGDAHIDCDDQDCEVFALCVKGSAEESAEAASETPQPARITVFAAQQPKEIGRACADLTDNDGNGLTDCEEPQCQRHRYCRREMYEYPDDPSRMPGMFVNFGFGVALPNYRHPRAETDSVYGDNISFDPDLGGMMDLQLGMLFHRFVGAGASLKWAITGASNHDYHVFSDQDDDEYKFVGLKSSGNVGGFIRVQWPFERVVPYLNIHAGYSWAKHRLHVYDGANTWDDIEEHESDDSWPIEGEKDVVRPDTKRHFTFALEPGIDVQVVQRFFGVGLKAWLPVVASSDSDTDNVGVILSFSFTPQWRGQRVLKEKYRNPPAPAPAPALTPGPASVPLTETTATAQ